MHLLFDPLFRVPLAAGLIVALLLPLIGCYLRVRDEWLAALGLAQVAAAAHLIGAAFALPLWATGLTGAAIAVLLKYLLKREGNGGYALMILGGWAALYLVAANTPMGEALSHALSDGQLYFATREHLVALAVAGAVLLAGLPWWSRRLLRSRFFPHWDSANQSPQWPWQMSFDLMVALLLALATSTVGLMAAFALIFLPPWLAFRLSPNWRTALLLASVGGFIAYLLAFALALKFDQPFGPVLVATLLLLTACGRVATLLLPASRH